MAYKRIKIINGNPYWYEQETYRKNGKNTTKHVRYIGKASEDDLRRNPILNNKKGYKRNNRELMPIHDTAKNFYGKAIVKEQEYPDGDRVLILYSYNTPVAHISKKKGKATVMNVNSATTLRHVKEFLKQEGFKAETKSQLLKDYTGTSRKKETLQPTKAMPKKNNPSNSKPKLITSQDLLRQRGLMPPLKDKTTNLPVQFSINVPSTKHDKNISKKEFDKRIRETRRFLAEEFGGDTSVKAEGGYVDKDGKLIEENVVVVESLMNKDTYNKKKDRLEKFIKDKQKEWKQETIGFKFEDDLYIYPKFD